MAEINLDGEPIFVDVANEPQLPILYSQLLDGDSDVEDNSINKGPAKHNKITKNLAKPNTSAASNESERLDQPQIENVPQSKQDDEMEITIAGIKVENDRLKCPICKRFKCRDKDRMMRHIRVHQGLNPYQCYMCDYSTYNSIVFKEHVNVHQGIKPFKCRFCDHRSASKKNTYKHEKRHRKDNPLKCPDCDFIAWHATSLRSHRVNKHQAENVKNLSCKVCKCKFVNEGQKKYHRSIRRQCKLCAYVTCSKILFNAHMQQDHNITIARKEIKTLFTCALCPWSSNSKPKILLHLIHHPNQPVNEDVVDITVLRNCGIMD